MIFWRRIKPAAGSLLTAENNPYKARIQWPPDLTKLDHTKQFAYERKFRRRSKMKYQPEWWMKGTKTAQTVIVTAFCIYGLLFAEWSPPPGELPPEAKGGEPFGTLRKFVLGPFRHMWSKYRDSTEPVVTEPVQGDPKLPSSPQKRTEE